MKATDQERRSVIVILYTLNGRHGVVIISSPTDARLCIAHPEKYMPEGAEHIKTTLGVDPNDPSKAKWFLESSAQPADVQQIILHTPVAEA